MNYENKSDAYYKNVRHEMLKYLPHNARKIIDVGCGSGAFAKEAKHKNKAEVWGIEYMPNEAAKAERILDKVFAGSIEDNLNNIPQAYFDVVYFNDVLEHLVNPYLVLEKFKEKLTPNGVVISSLPNIRYHNALIPILFKKDFKYKSAGVMDYTHLHFFTEKSIKRMYEKLGYDIILHEGINRSRSLRPILYNIPLLFSHMDIFYPQFATVTKVKNKMMDLT